MQKTSLPSINLAKNRGEKFVDRFLQWALTIGRGVVILTEALALGAFLFRFGLDRQLVDLHDRIKQEQAILVLLKDSEKTYRNLQDRLSLAATINTQLSGQIKTFNDLLGLLPTSLSITNLSISDTTVRIEGTIDSLVSLSSFVKKIKTYPQVTKVSLDKLDSKAGTGTLSIGLTITLQSSKTKPIL